MYAQLIYEYGFSVKDVYSACPTKDDCIALSIQMKLYVDYLSDDLAGSALDKELRTYLLEGFKFSQVKTAYGISITLETDISELLSKEDSTKLSANLSETDKDNYESFAADLGVNVNALVRYAEEKKMSFVELEKLVNRGRYHENEIRDNQSSQPKQSSQSMMSTMSEGDVTEYPDKYLGSPYSYDYNKNESVNLNSGSMEFESIDYTLPGVNGLDLVIGRRYDSQAANVYDPIGQGTIMYEYMWYVHYGALAYWSNWIGTDRLPSYDFGPVDTGLTDFSSMLQVYNSIPAREVYPAYWTNPDTDLIYEYYKEWRNTPVNAYPYYYSSTQNNTYLNDLYGLGYGWSFMFSSIESGKYLRLADGRAYEIFLTSTTGDSNLKDYTLTDVRLEQESGIYTNGVVSSSYTLYYKDGKREFFSSDGKLIGIKDRFDNTIKFINDTYNGYPRITITDTLNRVTTIYGQSSTGGHTMFVTLPESNFFSYDVSHITSPVSCMELAQYHDPLNVTTSYSYTISSGGFDVYNKSTGGATNYYANLSTITHPTGAQSVYNYEQVNKNLGPNGLQVNYRLTSRADKIGATSYNEKIYVYSSNNNSGWPANSNPGSLPVGFTYDTTATTTATGVSTKFTFSYQHLTTTAETRLGSAKIQDVLYQYSSDKLPTQETTKKYDYTNQSLFVQSIKANTYDNNSNVTASWSPLADGNTSNTEYKTTYTYNSTYSLPLSVSYKQDSATTVLTQYTLDASFKKITREEVLVNNVRKSMTDYTYDSYGNILSKKAYKDGFVNYVLTEYAYQNNAYLSEEKISGVTNADSSSAIGSPTYGSGIIAKSQHYDNLGRLDQSKDANGNITSYEYDGNSNVIRITNPDSTTKQYARYYADNYVIVTDEQNNQLKYTYTPLGLESQTIDVLTSTPMISRTYDTASRLITLTDAVYGSVTTYGYDYQSRVTSEVVTQGVTALSNISYAYTDACESGTLQKVIKTVTGDSNAPSTVTAQYKDKMGFNVKNSMFMNSTEYFDTYTYDYIGNKLTEKLAYAVPLGLAYSSRWEYDHAGHVLKAYNADQNYVTSAFDELGNLTTLTDIAGTAAAYTYVASPMSRPGGKRTIDTHKPNERLQTAAEG